MILADTSVWIDHLRSGDAALARRLERNEIAIHSFVIGEIALGNLRQRDALLSNLHDLPRLASATDDEVLAFVDANQLAGKGIGFVDAHLRTAVRLSPGCTLWTRDKALESVASSLRLTTTA